MVRGPLARRLGVLSISAVLWAGGALAAPLDPLACDIEDPSPGRGGSFEAVASGEQPGVVELAGFATSSGKEGVGWSLQLMTPGGANTLLFVTEDAGRPEPGTYAIVDYVAVDASPPPGKYTVSMALEGDVLGASGFFSVKGRLEIVESSPEQVAGCFELTARDLPGSTSAEASGSFVSRNQDMGERP